MPDTWWSASPLCQCSIYGPPLINKNTGDRYPAVRRGECGAGRRAERAGSSWPVRHYIGRGDFLILKMPSLRRFTYPALPATKARVLQRHNRASFSTAFAWAVCEAIRFFVKIDGWTSLIAAGMTVSRATPFSLLRSFVRKRKDS